ncbi:MAG TPA: aldose 1-epimerase family protein [Streptosporangiaceae bacterium]
MTKPAESARSAVPAADQPPERPRSVAQAAAPRPLTGAQHHIRAGDYQASVTELGGGLRELTYRGRRLITGYQPDELPPAGAGQLLLPWPNRIDGGKYEFGGASYQLDLSEPARGNAIHGLTRWANWEPAAPLARGEAADADGAASQITLSHVLYGRPGYPFCLELSVSYRLEPASGLRVTISACNAGSRPAPYGTGSHPYLTAGAPVIDDCELQIPASRWLPTDDRGIPSGPAQDVAGTPFDFRTSLPIGDTKLDHALTGLSRDESGLAWARLASGSMRLGLWAGPGYNWLQVFTGDALAPGLRRKALAFEPMTCPANAFVSGDGLLTLAPADSVTHTWGIRVFEP